MTVVVVGVDTDCVLDFNDDTAPLSVVNSRPICPEKVVDTGTIAPE